MKRFILNLIALLFINFYSQAQFLAKATYEETKPGFDLRKFGFENSDQVPLSAAQIASVNRRVRSEKDIYILFFDQYSSLFQFDSAYLPWLDESTDQRYINFYKNDNIKKRYPVFYQNSRSGTVSVIGGTLPVDYMVYDELSNVNQWKMVPEDSTISGFKCQKALELNGKNKALAAWYTPDIPVTIGPERYGGLPGLIVALEFEDGKIMVLKKIEEIDPKIFPNIASPQKANKISMEEWPLKFPNVPGFD